MKFTDLRLKDELQQTLSRMNYTTLTPIQERCIPALLQGQSLVAQSQTGSGKTLAYALPLLGRVRFEEYHPQALILVPTRELALQVKQTLDSLGMYCRTRHLMLVGRQSFRDQREDLKQRTHVLIATPGRLLQHMQEETLDLSQLSLLVLDEADEMFKLGFRKSLNRILQRIPQTQRACFSATYPDSVDDFLQEHFAGVPKLLLPRQTLPAQLTQHFMAVSLKKRDALLTDVLASFSLRRCIVFVNTIETADTLCARLREQEILCGTLHGEMLQEERFAALQAFREGQLRMLIATNVAARGLDIPDVSLILNYDFPLNEEIYIHRVGRTARMEAQGAALSFVTPRDQEVYQRLRTEFPDLEGPTWSPQPRYPAQLTQPLPPEKHRDDALRAEKMKLCILAGKSKKLRPGDLVGAICGIEGISAEDIGVISVQEHRSYVEILHGKGEHVLNALQGRTIKNRKIKAELARS